MEPLLPSQNNHYVYYLIDLRNGLPFYIGKGKGNRMYDHEKAVSKGLVPNNNSFLFRKIRKIKSKGLTIIYRKIAENLDDKSALAMEIAEIKKIGRYNTGNGTLCNLTDGGKGNSGKILREETKLRFSSSEEKKRTAESTRKGMFSSGYVERVSKEISLMSPIGQLITAKNISKFCRDNNFQNGNVYKVLRGEIKTHRGWTLPKNIQV